MRLPALATLSIALFATLSIALFAMPATAQDPREVAERVHREGGYPSDAPVLGSGGPSIPGAGGGPRGDARLDPDREAGERGTGDDLFAPILRDILGWLGSISALFGGPVAWILLAIGLTILALLAGILIVRLRFGAAQAVAGAPVAARADDEIDPMLVGPGASAEELAAQGRYREAIHALFVDALGRIGGREGRMRGRTARELVWAVAPERPGRPELGALLDVTELVWFGGREASAEQYEHARELSARVPGRVETTTEEAA